MPPLTRVVGLRLHSKTCSIQEGGGVLALGEGGDNRIFIKRTRFQKGLATYEGLSKVMCRNTNDLRFAELVDPHVNEELMQLANPFSEIPRISAPKLRGKLGLVRKEGHPFDVRFFLIKEILRGVFGALRLQDILRKNAELISGHTHVLASGKESAMLTPVRMKTACDQVRTAVFFVCVHQEMLASKKRKPN